MREPHPYEHEVWASEGREDLSPHELEKLKSKPPVVIGPPSASFQKRSDLSGAIWGLMFLAQDISRLVEQGYKPFNHSAQDDLRLTIAKLTRIADELERTPL